MKVLVDTCIWSLALRGKNKPQDALVVEFQELVKDARVQLIGPIRQEILSGIKKKSQFLTLKNTLSAFPDLLLVSEDFELAAEYFNILRGKGIQGSNTDFLICSVSTRNNLPIFTYDKDFNLFIEHIPIALHEMRSNMK
ncbi:MAG: PIN domain-containing protein [FCB group bacterium]|nr:PIN domain-containing protein [FCB group bacterium]